MKFAFLVAGAALAAAGLVWNIIDAALCRRRVHKKAEDAVSAMVKDKKVTISGIKTAVETIACREAGRASLPHLLTTLGLGLVIVSLSI